MDVVFGFIAGAFAGWFFRGLWDKKPPADIGEDNSPLGRDR